MQQTPKDVKSVFTIDYSDLDGNKSELWKKGRNFFSRTYGDFNSVFKTVDIDQGILIGRAIFNWNLVENNCSSYYEITFVAKDQKARLRLELIDAVPATSACKGWSWPTKSGYKEVVMDFKNPSERLETELKGNGKTDDVMDF